jgi:hypothetical protein
MVTVGDQHVVGREQLLDSSDPVGIGDALDSMFDPSSATQPSGSAGSASARVNPPAKDRPHTGDRFASVARVSSSRSVESGVVRSCGSTAGALVDDLQTADASDSGGCRWGPQSSCGRS